MRDPRVTRKSFQSKRNLYYCNIELRLKNTPCFESLTFKKLNTTKYENGESSVDAAS